jgi:antibiotic biosynthesis monooxygenase (ABM) superfamily enzyme
MFDFFLGGIHWGLWLSGFLGTLIVVIAAIVFVVFIISDMLETWAHRRKKARFQELKDRELT